MEGAVRQDIILGMFIETPTKINPASAAEAPTCAVKSSHPAIMSYWVSEVTIGDAA
jgi:hypothetical protein